MKTLTEITHAEAERRDKAWRFEKLSNEAARLRRSIAQLENQQPANADALERIFELAGQLPRDLTTKGMRFIAGGFIVQEILQAVAGDALGDVRRKQQAVAAALAKAKADLVKVEAALTEFI
jgi:hypothetical protein